MLQAGKADIIAKEMVHYNLSPGFGRNKMDTVRGGQVGCGQPIIYSEHEYDWGEKVELDLIPSKNPFPFSGAPKE